MPQKKYRSNTVHPSTTDPNDPEAVPAFETSAGLPRRSNAKPVVVNRTALENFNAKLNPELVKNQIEAANVAALFTKRAIRPDEIAALRRRMFEVVQSGLEDVAEVMSGQKQWSNVQVRLFSILTERVMPKLSTITVEDTTSKQIEDLSIEELEAIALGKKNHLAVDAIVKQGGALESQAERSESIATGKKLKKVMTEVAGLDAGEKAYGSRLPPKEIVSLKKQTPDQTRV